MILFPLPTLTEGPLGASVGVPASTPARYDVVPLVAGAIGGDVNVDEPVRPVWMIGEKRIALPKGASVLAVAASRSRSLIYQISDGNFTLINSSGALVQLPKSAKWYGLDPAGRLLSLHYRSGKYVIQRNSVEFARTPATRPGYDTVDAPRIVCSAGGDVAVGYDSGRRANDAGAHAIDTAVYDKTGRRLWVWRNVTPKAFAGRYLVASPYIPFVQQPEGPVNRVLSLVTGRSVLQFSGDPAIADERIVSLSSSNGVVVDRARIVWPPDSTKAILRIPRTFKPGWFLTLVRLQER